jgi:hypothetical protein
MTPKAVLACLLITAAASAAAAQSCADPNKPPAKVSPKALANLKEGKQELFVYLEATDIGRQDAKYLGKVQEQRRESSIPFRQGIDDKPHQETLLKLAALERSVFPDGRLGRAVVRRHIDRQAGLEVSVPDLETLQELRCHPLVNAVLVPEERVVID